MIDEDYFNQNFKDKKFDYLTAIDYSKTGLIIFKCVCGRKVAIKPSVLLDGRKRKSCGCYVTKQQLPTLYKLYSTFSAEEKSNWNSWEDFVQWCKSNGYSPDLCTHKKNRKLPYNKENLEFGIFVNKEFFSVIDLKNGKYYYNERKKMFVTSIRINGKMTTFDDITKALNKTNDSHKKMDKDLFLIFKFRTKEL